MKDYFFSDLKTYEYEPLPSRRRTVFTSLTTKETFASGNYMNKNTIQFSKNISNNVLKMIQLYLVVDIFKKLSISAITATHFGISYNSIWKNMMSFTFFPLFGRSMVQSFKWLFHINI